jgi:CheY-like chemotaxis protein
VDSLLSIINAILYFSKIEAGKKIDVILSNYSMPGMNGFSFLKKIKVIADYNKIPIIILTSIGMVGDRNICKKIGIEGYLSKHVRKQELELTIASVLGLADQIEANKPNLVTKYSIPDLYKEKIQILLVERLSHQSTDRNKASEQRRL